LKVKKKNQRFELTDEECCKTNLTVSNVEQSVYSVQVLPQNHDKLYCQDKSWTHSDRV